MARYHFYLKNKNPDKESPIILVINYSYNRVVFYTMESILPKFWDSKAQRASQVISFPEYPEFNQKLNNIKTIANNVFRCYQNDHDQKEPSPSEYKKLLEASIKGTKSGIPTTLIAFFEYFIEQTRKKLVIQNKNNSRNDIANSYQQTLTCVKDFAKDKNKRIDFDTMDNDFYVDFIEYLQSQKKFTLNNSGKHIKNLKRILNEASTPEMNVNKFTFYKRFTVIKEDTDSIYLNEAELQAMHELDLSDNMRLDRVRDLFLIGAWTGLRFSDFSNIQPKDIQGDYIHIETQKTKKKVVIPLHPVVKSIMKKYNNKLPEISNVKMNLYLKEIGKKLDILQKPENITITKAGQTISKNVFKWELLTTHTCRRSFATNMYKAGVPTITIMAVTGHKTEKAFLSYIKVTPDEHARIMMKYFQKQNLRIA